MIQRKAYRFRLEPDDGERSQMGRFAGSCRFVWNKALAEQKARLERGEKTAGYAVMCKWLTAWRHEPETAWLAEAHVHPLQQKLKDLDRAIRDSFRKGADAARKRFPRFKKKGLGDGFRYPMSIKAEALHEGWGRVWLPKIGWIKYRASRPLEGDIAQATLSERCGQWFVSIQTEREMADPPSPSAAPVGIDMGVARFATLSDGTVFEPLNAFRKIARRLRRAQRKLARKKRASANWKKQKARVARLRAREADARNDYLHKVSTAIAKNHGLVVVENLAVARMSASAKGTADESGRNVRAKAGLNRAILDQGWARFRSLLAYKLAERGGGLVSVDPRNTSRTCPACGHVAAANRKTQAEFVCVSCGQAEHADLNAAQNILAAGLAAAACGGTPHQRPREAGTSLGESA